MSAAGSDRAWEAQAFIARRLAENPRISANDLYREAKAAGVATRRTDFLHDVRDMAEYFNLQGRRVQANPARFAPHRATTEQDVASVLSLARRKYHGAIAPARREFNREHPDRSISMRAIQHTAPSATEKRHGRWQAKAFDRLSRTMDAITTEGIVTLAVRDSRTASKIAAHANAVKTFLDTGDASGLRPFRNMRFTVDHHTYTFETDLDTLIEQAEADDLDDLQYGT